MSFQRSYSKVWWGSEHQSNADTNNAHMFVTSSNNFTDDSSNSHSSSVTSSRKQQEHHGEEMYHSLDLNNYKRYTGNLSCIQEHEDEYNSSKLSWPTHNSPGSLRSQVPFKHNVVMFFFLFLSLSFLLFFILRIPDFPITMKFI